MPALGSPGTGGLAPAIAAECNGDECESPPPAPDDPTPGTAVINGPPNPPVHYPKPHGKKKHKKRHRHKRARG